MQKRQQYLKPSIYLFLGLFLCYYASKLSFFWGDALYYDAPILSVTPTVDPKDEIVEVELRDFSESIKVFVSHHRFPFHFEHYQGQIVEVVYYPQNPTESIILDPRESPFIFLGFVLGLILLFFAFVDFMKWFKLGK